MVTQRHSHARRWALVAFCCAQLCVVARAAAPTEYEVKAAFVYNFGKYVSWPAGADSAAMQDFSICILGEDPFGDEMDRVVANRMVQGRKIAVYRLADFRQLQRCQILFISASEANDLPEVLKAARASTVLTVSDIERFAERGGMVYLRMEQNRVRFDVNLSAAESAGLSVSSQLLKLAHNVIGQPKGGE